MKFFTRTIMAIGILFQGAQGLTVVVQNREGAPTLMVNGKPERMRIFWGHGLSSGGAKEIGREWEQVSFSFSIPEDDPGTTFHLRFGEEAGDVYLDDISLEEQESHKMIFSSDFEKGLWSNNWTFWCKDRSVMSKGIGAEGGQGRNSSGGLHVVIPRVDGAKGFHLYTKPVPLQKGLKYQARVWIRANGTRVLKPEWRHAGGDYHFLGGIESPFASELRLARDAGIRLISFPVPLCWKEGGKTDFSEAFKPIRDVLALFPQALILPRVDMKAPDWWLRANPEEVMTYEGGRKNNQASPASFIYRKEATEALGRLVAAMEAAYPQNIFGYHPSGQNTGEWFYMDSWGREFCGYDGGTARAWREDSGKAVPSPGERREAFGQIRHPGDRAAVVEFEKWRQNAMAALLIDFAGAIRKNAPKKLSAFFYGYLFEFGGLQNGPANSGHYALQRLLESPAVDMICAPISYFHRGLGGATTGMSAAESVALSGKLWLNEDDTRTHRTRETSFPGWRDGGTNEWQTRQLLRRNVFWEACRNQATWWMDLGGSGWFDDPALWQEMKSLAPVDQYFLDHPTPYQSEVALVVDETSMLYIGASGNSTLTTKTLIREIRSNMNTLGANVGQFLAGDFISGKGKAKLHVMAATWALDAKERAGLAVAMNGKHALWAWLPGYIDGVSFSTRAVGELTYFTVKEMPEGSEARVKATALGLALGLESEFGPKGAVKPLLTPIVEAGDEVLATYATGEPAVVTRTKAGGSSTFCGTTEITRGLLRACGLKAGVKFLTSVPLAVCGNGPFIGVHGCGSEAAVPLQMQGTFQDVISGEFYRSSGTLTLPLKFGETKILKKLN